MCYVGLVFKIDTKHVNPDTACCAAQMFLDSGDGVVFKGNVGPWLTGKTGEYHLSHDSAKQLLGQAIQAYREKHGGDAPKEIFLHGRTRFADEEWRGFQEAAGADSVLVGVRIAEAERIRIYRQVGSNARLARFGLGTERDLCHPHDSRIHPKTRDISGYGSPQAT